ncbi:MAG: response regulator [Deltaproteobacteria bacterium]|nr:response regulator [Deltaproteobacteria bacterium]
MSKTSILIVEDEAIVAADLANKLTQLGYEVAGIAAQGAEAVEMALSLRPQLILMDVRLEGPLDGVEAAGEIRARHDVPVIYLTAHSDSATLARAKLTGPFGYILKPFEERDLATQIELALFKHQAERKLREQREWLRVTLTSIGDAVIATDAEGLISFLNPVAESLTGWSMAEAVGRPLKEVFRIVNEHTRAPVEDPVIKVLRNGKIVGLANHTVLLRKDGREAAIDDSDAPIIDEQGRVQGVVLVFRDISERRRTEAEREQLLSAIEHVADTVVITDPGGTIQYVNPAFERVTGYTKAEALGKNPRILKSGRQDQTFYSELWQTISRGKTFQGRMVNKRKDGTLYTEDATISPVFSTKGRIVAYVAVKRDVTHYLALQEQFHQAQKMESVGRLAGGVAHDFNNMLGIIIGHAELALEETAPVSPVYDDLNEIRRTALRSADLTRQLLAFARKQVTSPQVLDLNDTVTGMIKMLRRLIGEDIDLAWAPGANLWLVKIDPAQTDQLLANLCVNARDAIGGVGRITIETKNTILDEAYCAAHAGTKPGQYVTLSVRDNGCGMNEETLNNLFEPFFTTKEVGKGTGLGLSTVYGIVRQNEGYIDVISRPGQGARFTIYLPRTLEALQLDGEPHGKPTAKGAETLLLVEDEQSILRLAKAVLERLGYTVLATPSPVEALTIAERYENPIHLLITDVVMPGMNGQQLRERIEKHIPAVKVLFMSGYTADAVAHGGILERGVRFLQKPFSNKALAEKVREVLDGE